MAPKKNKRKYKKRRSRKKNSMAIADLTNNRTPLPNLLKTSFKYCEDVQLSGVTAGTASAYVFSCNGMYDANISQVGHQPLGFDELMLFYNHYTIIGSKIKCTFSTQDTDAPVIVAIQVRDTASVETVPSTVRENGNVIYRLIGTEASNHQVTLSKSFSAKNFFGKKPSPVDDQYRGHAGANPTEQAFYHMSVGAYTGSATVPTVTMNVEIDYIAILSEPKVLTQS